MGGTPLEEPLFSLTYPGPKLQILGVREKVCGLDDNYCVRNLLNVLKQTSIIIEA